MLGQHLERPLFPRLLTELTSFSSCERSYKLEIVLEMPWSLESRGTGTLDRLTLRSARSTVASMRQLLKSVLVVLSLGAALTFTGPAGAAKVEPHAATLCGLSVATLTRYFGAGMSLSGVSEECGITGDGFSVSVYVFPKSETAAVVAQEHHPKGRRPLGGLGAGADVFVEGGGYYILNLTTGPYFVELYAEAASSLAKMVTLAHVVYRGLA